MGKTSKSIYDNSGREIKLKIIQYGSNIIYTGEVTNMISTEIPLRPIFESFGKNIVIKADFNPDVNTCLFSVFSAEVYGLSQVSPTTKVINYTDYQQVMNTSPDYIDAIICASYDHEGELSVSPLIYESKPPSAPIKIILMFLLGILMLVFPYVLAETSLKEILFVICMFLKEHILTTIMALL